MIKLAGLTDKNGKEVVKKVGLRFIDSKKHEVFTVNKCKIALNRDDDKRLIQSDGITTLARGYVTDAA